MFKVVLRKLLFPIGSSFALAVTIVAAPSLTCAQSTGGPFALAAAPSVAASAQPDAASVNPGIVPASSSDQIEEIVVTAQKRSENLQQVPVSVSVLNSMELATMGISNVNGLALKVPSLSVNENIPTQVSYKIRGLGNEGRTR